MVVDGSSKSKKNRKNNNNNSGNVSVQKDTVAPEPKSTHQNENENISSTKRKSVDLISEKQRADLLLEASMTPLNQDIEQEDYEDSNKSFFCFYLSIFS